MRRIYKTSCGYFAAIVKGDLFRFAIDSKETGALCCRRFFEQYVMQQSSLDLQSFAEQLHLALPSISVGSLKMKTQNIKQLCIEHGIKNSLDAKPLNRYSQQNYRVFQQIKREFGF